MTILAEKREKALGRGQYKNSFNEKDVFNIETQMPVT